MRASVVVGDQHKEGVGDVEVATTYRRFRVAVDHAAVINHSG